MKELPAKKIWGIGPKTAARLQKEGIETCADLQALDRGELARRFGSFGLDLFLLCRGIDERPVQSNRIRKSLSNERTFSQNLGSLSECSDALAQQHEELMQDLKQSAPDRAIAKVFVKLKFADFKRTTAEASAAQPHKRISRSPQRSWGRKRRSPPRLGVRFAEAGQRIEQLEWSSLLEGNPPRED